jgi:hypothetical protein
MTYKDQFVVEVKCRGKFLRVVDDVVRLPFGSEYSLYLKNLNSRRASVKISIDGQDVLDGHALILDANSSTELEGFLRGTTAKNRFMFINKTKEIQEFRGDKVDDGIIRVEFAYEQAKPIRKLLIEDHHEHHHHHHHDYYHWNYNDWFVGDSTVRYGSTGDVRGIASSFTVNNSNEPVASAFYSSNVSMDSLGVESLGQPLDDEGITVKGSECFQDFRYGSIGELEEAQVMIIRLKGITGSQPVQQPITVDTKLTCSTCGKVSKSSYKFCPNCGTFLE